MLIYNLLLAIKKKITADKIRELVRCQSSRMEGHGLMNILDSFEQNWFNTPNCEAIYLSRNKTITFWHTSSIYNWRLMLQSAFLRKEQSFLYSQLRKPSSVVAKRADTSPCKRPACKEWGRLSWRVGLYQAHCWGESGIPCLVFCPFSKDTKRLKKVEKRAKGGRKNTLKWVQTV